MSVAVVGGVLPLGANTIYVVVDNVLLRSVGNLSLQDNGNNQAVDTEDTCHDDGKEGLVDQFTLQDTNGCDSDSGLGATVGGPEVAENESGGDSHETEEGVLVGIIHFRQSDRGDLLMGWAATVVIVFLKLIIILLHQILKCASFYSAPSFQLCSLLNQKLN